MSLGDFIIRRNAAETDTLPNAGTNLNCAWDTLVYDEGALSYAAGIFTVGATAPHLIMFSEQFFTTNTTNNERVEVQGELLINGTPVEEGKCQDYIRKASGQQECIVSGYAIIELTSGDTVATRYYRTDNSTSGTISRLTGFGGVQILELDTTDAFGIYSTTSTRSSTTAMVAVNWDSNDRQDTGFTRTTTEINLTSAGQYLVCISGDVTLPSTSRVEAVGELRLNGTPVVGTRSSCYMRGADGCQDGALSGIYLINATAGDDLSFAFKHVGNTVVLGIGFSIQVWKLPSGATSTILEATTGDMNVSGNFSWDTNPLTHADFSHTLGTSGVTVNQIGHYLSMSSLGATTPSAVQRGYPGVRQSVNGAVVSYGGGGAYHRNSGGTGQIGITSAAIITSVGSSSSISTNALPLGAAGTLTCQSGQMAVINLASIYTYVFPPSVSDVNTDEQIDIGELNNVITGTDFEAAQGTGFVEIGPNSDYTGTKVTQSIDSWASTSIQFDLVIGFLDEGPNYIFVTGDTGSRSAGFLINVGEAPFSLHLLQPVDHYWPFDNSHIETVNGNDSDNVISGSPDFVATPISRSTTYSLRMSGLTDRAETPDSNFMNIGSAQDRRDMGGWIQFDTTPITPLAIYEEGGGINNFYFILGFGGILLANCADSSNNFKVQAFSDFRLAINRPYHILFSFQGSGFNDEFRLYVDGVLQATTDGNPVGNTVIANHSGDIGWGRPDGTLDTGGTDIQYNSLTTLLLSNWGSWSGSLSSLTVSEIRDIFVKSTLADSTLTSNTNSAMQTALEVLDNTIRTNHACSLKVRAPTDNGGDLSLTATNIYFDASSSIHLMWMGALGEVLTWRNGGTSNASIVEAPNGGTVTLIETSPITITVRDDDDSTLLENARVILLSNGAPLPSNDVVTITRVGTVATVAHTAHGVLNNQDILIQGSNQNEYFGKKTITVVDANSYTFTVTGSPTTPATGIITSTAILLFSLTDVNGVASSEIDYVSDQPVIGYVRSAVTQTYTEAPIQGTVTLGGFSSTVFLIKN